MIIFFPHGGLQYVKTLSYNTIVHGKSQGACRSFLLLRLADAEAHFKAIDKTFEIATCDLQDAACDAAKIQEATDGAYSDH